MDAIYGAVLELAARIPPHVQLRDWFAGQAVSAMAGAGGFDCPGGMWIRSQDDAAQLAERAYWIADAMLAARQQLESSR